MNHIKLDTRDFKNWDALMGAQLSESVQDIASLNIELKGLLPEGWEYMTPVTLMHRGRVLFHGKIISATSSVEATATVSQVVVQNFLWLFNRQVLTSQLSVLASAPRSADGVISSAGLAILRPAEETREEWMENFAVYAAGWTVDAQGDLLGESELTMDASESDVWRGANSDSTKLYTAWQAMLRAKDVNPDLCYRVDYTRGTILAGSIARAEVQTWDTAVMPMMSASDIAPNYDLHVTGVVVCAREHENEDYNYAVCYPPDVDMLQEGVKFFEVKTTQGYAYQKLWMTYAKQYYESANVLTYEGSISILDDLLDESPLGYALNLVGMSIPLDWGQMQAYVRAVDWDLATGEVSLELGRDINEPEFSAYDFSSSESEDEATTTTAGDGGGDPPPPDDVTTTEEGTMPPIFPTFGDSGSGSAGSLGSIGTVGTQGSVGTSGSLPKDCWTEEELLEMIRNQIKYTTVANITGFDYLSPPAEYPASWTYPHPDDNL